ncbi:MucR family transcriptional regulator [Magnetococcales bacterium HHB-1]
MSSDLLKRATDIVTAYVSNPSNVVSAADIPRLIDEIYLSLARISGETKAPGPGPSGRGSVKKGRQAEPVQSPLNRRMMPQPQVSSPLGSSPLSSHQSPLGSTSPLSQSSLQQSPLGGGMPGASPLSSGMATPAPASQQPFSMPQQQRLPQQPFQQQQSFQSSPQQQQSESSVDREFLPPPPGFSSSGDMLSPVQSALDSRSSSMFDEPKAEPPPQPKRHTPIVPISEAVREDVVICLICGKECKALKGHLTRSHRISIEEYRERFGLPKSFPLVAPSYSAHRRKLAKDAGLGERLRARPGTAASATQAEKSSASASESSTDAKQDDKATSL